MEDFIVAANLSALEAMKKLNATSEKSVFVTSQKGKLIGSLTDGDIRRWILAGKSLDTEVTEVCNKVPHLVKEGYDIQYVKSLMIEHKITCIPVVNDAKQPVKLLFWTDIFGAEVESIKKDKLDLPVVIMAGGFGTRLKPFTTILPKPLIPIGNKSIVEKIIDKFRAHDIKDYFMTLNHKSKIIRSYFNDIEKDYNIQFVDEPKPLGTAGSLKLLQDYLPDRFIVSNCDIIINADYAELVRLHEESNNQVTLVSSMMHYKIPYGICEIDKGGELLEIREKPEYNFLISTGMYVLNKSVLDLIPDGEFFHITHLMESVKTKGGKVGVYPISENSWFDTGQWEEYNKTLKILSGE
ncbi:nucleotidyltransferase family protein [Roseivirga thermotolerans]|uniref:Nucleotidyltransferase n=1 Tax=Roseivirga thermotolerans TaxID=1758176 RepID=A0ABQ3I4F1_9BACT|nr:nucleotidyltransferase family protein [Roseivirga thermotolerans]GHE53497.1 nucleotidyltransferase [Roseivirga thermotolerans]